MSRPRTAAGMTSAPLPASTFVERFLRLNGLDAGAFAGWELLPGMGFGERGAWWSDGADRGAPHEGLDLRRVRTRDGRGATLGPGTRIPVLWPGTVAAVASDFLGRSVFVAHEPVDGAGRRLHSAYGHIAPRPGLARGGRRRAGGEVGTIADPAARESRVPAHLHLTVAWVAAGPRGALGWSALHDPARSALVDPLPLLGC